MSCLQHIDTESFLTSLTQAPATAVLPLCTSIELTRRCTMNCDHCFLPDHSGHDECSTGEWKEIITMLAHNEVLSLLFTGGEPLCRTDFRELYQHAKQAGLLVSLFTTATLIDDDLADFLAERRPRRIEIPIYSRTPKVHDHITGITGSLEKTINAIQRLQQRDLPIYIKTMVMNSNLHELPTLRAWCEESGFPFRYDAMINPKLNGDPAPLRHRVTPRTFTELTYPAAPPSSLPTTKDIPVYSGHIPLLRCGAGTQSVHIDSTGKLHPCTIWREHPFDLHTTPIDQWPAHLGELKKLSLPDTSNCATCQHLTGCLVCPALSALEASAGEQKIDYLCAICSQQHQKNVANDTDSGKIGATIMG